jgi:plasmid stability protein
MIARYHRPVAQLLVRQLDEDVKEALQRRARAHGRSTEEEVREILRDAVRAAPPGPVRLGSTIASRFRGGGVDHDFAELRGHPSRGADLSEP